MAIKMIKRKYFYSYVSLSREGRPIASGDGVLTVTSLLELDIFTLTGKVKNKAKADNPQAVHITLLAFNRV